MAPLLAFLIAVTVLGAALVVTHIWLLTKVWRTPDVIPRDRWLAVVPFLLPWVAWRSGLKVATTIWAVLLVAYLVARLVG